MKLQVKPCHRIDPATHPEPQGTTYRFWCPGCKEPHDYDVRSDGGRPSWGFNGNLDRPTFTPSLLRRLGPYPDGHMEICHLFLTDGRLIFLGDCTHPLAGQTVDLPEMPENPWERFDDPAR